MFEGDYGDDGEFVYEKRRVLMPADVFLQRQFEQRFDKNVSFEDWKKSAFDERVDEMSKVLGKPDSQIPVPVEEYDVKGRRKDFQEGRHRGLAAAKRGEMVPVIQARKKLPPWDRENVIEPYIPKKEWSDRLGAPKPEEDQWSKEKGLFDYDSLADYNIDTDVVDSDEEIEETPRLVDGGDVVEDLSEEVDKRINDDPVVQMDYQYDNDYNTEVDNNEDDE